MTGAKHTFFAFAFLFSLVAFGGSTAATAEEESRFSGVAQLDLTSAYYFRGILQENRGFIAQPWGEVYASLYSSEDGLIRDVTGGFGVWLSIHSKETLASNGPESIYELDYYPLVSIDLAGGFNLLTIFYIYDSPNGAWGNNVHELNMKLSYDDSESLGLSPWVNLAIETESTSFGPSSGTGLQLGIAPTFYEGDAFSVSGSAEMGLAIDDYYEGIGQEKTFGYANLGVGLGVPISEMWSANVGFKYFIFGSDLELVNNGHGGHGVGTLSLTASF
jgi:hypothetical protein